MPQARKREKKQGNKKRRIQQGSSVSSYPIVETHMDPMEKRRREEILGTQIFKRPTVLVREGGRDIHNLRKQKKKP